MKDILSRIIQIFILLDNQLLPLYLCIFQLLHFLFTYITTFWIIQKMHIISTYIFIRFNKTSPIPNTTPYTSIIICTIKTKFPACVLLYYFFNFMSMFMDLFLKCFYFELEMSNGSFFCIILFLLFYLLFI